jgi:hypothetical protein
MKLPKEYEKGYSEKRCELAMLKSRCGKTLLSSLYEIVLCHDVLDTFGRVVIYNYNK